MSVEITTLIEEALSTIVDEGSITSAILLFKLDDDRYGFAFNPEGLEDNGGTVELIEEVGLPIVMRALRKRIGEDAMADGTTFHKAG